MRLNKYLLAVSLVLLVGCKDSLRSDISEVRDKPSESSYELTRDDSLTHLFFIAQKFEREGDSIPALMLYEQAYLLDQESTFLLEKISALSLSLNQPGTMIRALQQGKKIDDLADSTLRTISSIYTRYRMYDAAIMTLNNIDAKELDDSLFLTHLYEQSRQYDSAIEMYQALFPVMPPTIKAKIADLYRISSNFTKAEELYRQLLDSGDSLAGVQEGLALTYLAQKNDSLGISLLDSLIAKGDRVGELYPLARQILASYWWSKKQGEKSIALFSPLYKKSGTPDDVNYGRTLGVYYYLMGDFGKSEQTLSEVLEYEVSERYEVLYLYGASLEGLGKRNEAMEAYQESRNLEPSFSEARHALTLLYIRLNLLDSARTEAVKISEYNPKSVSGWALAGAVANMQEDYSSAVLYLEKASQLSDVNTAVLFEYAMALERTGKVNEAITQFRKLISIDSTHDAGLNYLSYIFAESNTHIDEAAELIRRALAITPENPAYLDTYGWVLYRQGKFVEARITLEKALSIMAEKDYVVYLHLGAVEAAIGNIHEAEAYFQKAQGCTNVNMSDVNAARDAAFEGEK